MSHRKKIVLNIFFFFCLQSLICGCSYRQKKDFRINEVREKAVDRYLSEFCSSAFHETKIYSAIHEVMMRMPADALKTVMDRRRPVLFTEIYDAGTARFASSSEIIVGDKEPPTFQQGMTILKISFALQSADRKAIMGIVAHELAHRVLDHVRQGKVSCDAEREANRLIKSWGFSQEFEAARDAFGHAKEGSGVASCQEKINE